MERKGNLKQHNLILTHSMIALRHAVIFYLTEIVEMMETISIFCLNLNLQNSDGVRGS